MTKGVDFYYFYLLSTGSWPKIKLFDLVHLLVSTSTLVSVRQEFLLTYFPIKDSVMLAICF